MKSESLGTQASGLNLDESNCARGVCEIGWKPAQKSDQHADTVMRVQAIESNEDIAGARLKQTHK